MIPCQINWQLIAAKKTEPLEYPISTRFNQGPLAGRNEAKNSFHIDGGMGLWGAAASREKGLEEESSLEVEEKGYLQMLPTTPW
jgi:hypothetical protein